MWNYSYSSNPFSSDSSNLNKAVGVMTSFYSGKALPGKDWVGLSFSFANEFCANNEAIGKSVIEGAANLAFHVGGGPTKTIHHDDGTKTIISYSGTGVDAESTIIKVNKDGTWKYV